jgi:hypothetical protein
MSRLLVRSVSMYGARFARGRLTNCKEHEQWQKIEQAPQAVIRHLYVTPRFYITYYTIFKLV